jgi:hypothetical protein
MLPAEDLFACVYVLIHDLIIAGLVAIPPRPGPAPGCSDAELLAIVMVRHLPGRRSEAGCGLRLAIKTDLGSRIARAWSIVPAAVSERDVADELLRNRAAVPRPAYVGLRRLTDIKDVGFCPAEECHL